MSEDEQKKSNGEQDTEDVTAEKMIKAAKVQLQGSEDILENVEADAVLDSAAQAAREAEKFNHGKNDAGVKK